MQLQKDILAAVQNVLQDKDIKINDNLIEHGLNSLRIIQLVDFFSEQYQTELSYVEFVSNPTVGDWYSIIFDNSTSEGLSVSGSHQSDSSSLKLQSSINKDYVLSDMQYAYWAGRQSENVSSHLYLEFIGNSLNIDAFIYAITTLIINQPMLRLQVSEQAKPSFLDISRINENIVHIDDLTLNTQQEIDGFIKAKRQRMTHQQLNITEGQVFDVSLTLLPKQQYHLHLDIDMIAVDPNSSIILLKQMSDLYAKYCQYDHEIQQNDLTKTNKQLYQHLQQELINQRNELSHHYFDYLYDKQYDTDFLHKQQLDKSWWQEQLESIAGIPELPRIIDECRHGSIDSGRMYHMFSVDQSNALQSIVSKHQLNMSSLLLSLFALTIGRWSSNRCFRINYPVFSRSVQIDEMLGDFSGFVVLNAELDDIGKQNLLNLCQTMEVQIKRVTSHTDYSGINVMRDLSVITKQAEVAPVVFSDLLGVDSMLSEQFQESLGKPICCISQGPKVDLDAQVGYFQNCLLINWDVRYDAFKGSSIHDIFQYYIHAIAQLINGKYSLEDSLLKIYENIDQLQLQSLKHIHTSQYQSNNNLNKNEYSKTETRIINELGLVCPTWVMGKLQSLTEYPFLSEDKSTLAYYDDAYQIHHYSVQESYIKRQGCFIDTQEVADVISGLDNIEQSRVYQIDDKLIAVVQANTTSDALHETIDDSLTHVLTDAISENIVNKLPAYLIPSIIYSINKFPLDSQGKIDDKALLTFLHQKTLGKQSKIFSTHSTPVEQVLMYMFAKLTAVSLDEFVATDDFFDIGGDSLSATYLVASINQYFQGCNLTVVDIFVQRTAKNIAICIEEKIPQLAPVIAKAFLAVI